MTKQIQLELDENLIAEATTIFDYFGLDMQTGIKMFLTRVAKDKSVTFLFGQLNQLQVQPQATHKLINEDEPATKDEFKITKSGAIRLFLNKGQRIARTVTFASKNRSAYNYWANPNFEVLNEDWSLILNDNKRRILYLFFIPAYTISKSQLNPRADIPELIDLQIMYNDSTFTDNRSGFSFVQFLTNEIDY